MSRVSRDIELVIYFILNILLILYIKCIANSIPTGRALNKIFNLENIKYGDNNMTSKRGKANHLDAKAIASQCH